MADDQSSIQNQKPWEVYATSAPAIASAAISTPATGAPWQQYSEHYQDLANDQTFDPVAHYSENPSPDTLQTAREVFKLRAAQPTNYGQAAVDFAKSVPGGIWSGVTGTVSGLGHAIGNIATEASPFASETDQERAQRENAAALQLGSMQGGDMLSGIGRNVQRLFGKTDRTLSDQEIEDQITHEAAHRAVVQGLQQGNVVEGGIGEPLGFGHVERENLSPEELVEKGSPVNPQAIEGESFLGNPATYAIAPVAEVAGPTIGRAITGPVLKGAGAAVRGAGELAGAAKGPIAAYKLFLGHDPITAGVDFAAGVAAKNLAPKIGTALTQAGAEAAGEALPPVGQNLITKAFKEGAKGAVTGTALSAPFVASAQSPEEAGQAVGGGFGIGAALGAAGGVYGSRQIDTAAKFGQLANEGSQINYGLGWDDANARAMATLPPDTQATINAYRGRYNGFTDDNGIPIQIYAAGGPDYAKAVAENGGGTATDTRGFISPDGTKIFLNADSVRGEPGKANVTLGHEAGGHLTEFLGEIAKAHDVATLQDTLRDSLYSNGQPTPQFSAFMRSYAADMLKGGASKAQIDALDQKYFEREFLAQHAAKILSGQNIASFNLPKPITERLMQGAGDWLRSQGILPKTGGDIGWTGREIMNVTSQLRDVLYNQGQQSEALRDQRAEGTEPSPTANYRIRQLEAQLKVPPTGTSTVDEVKAYQAAQRELDGLRAGTKQPAPFPAAGTPPTSPSAPVATPDAVTADAMKILATMGIPKAKAAAAIRLANDQHGSPINDAGNLATGALRITANGTVKPGEFIPKPAAPVEPVPVPANATFKDELGNLHNVTGPQQGAPRIGDIVATRDGQIRRITSIHGDTVDSARPIDPLNARGTLTHKLTDITPLAHDYAPPDPNTAQPEAAKLSVKPGPSGTFIVVDAAGNPVNKTTYATESAANQAVSRIGQRSTFGLPPSVNGDDIIDAIQEEGGINLSGMLKEERDHEFPHRGIWRNSLTTDNPNLTPDEVARLVAERGHGDGTPGTMFNEITKAIRARSSLRDQQAAEEARQKAETEATQNEPTQQPTPETAVNEGAGSRVASPPQAENPAEPAPLSQADVERLSTEAETAAIAAEKRGTTSKAAQERIRHARIDAVVAAHDAALPANYQGIRLHIDPDTRRQTISGRINPDRPFDAYLIKEAGLTPKQIGTLNELQNRIGQTVKVTDYQSAPESLGPNVTGESRRTAQEQSTAKARAAGEAEAQSQDKTFIPLGVSFNKGTGDSSPSITILGASPEKLLNNFNLAKDWIDRKGFELPYPNIHDPHFVADIKGGIRNHAAGWRFDGSAPVKGEAGTTPEEGYMPYVIEPTKAQFINLIFGDESAKTGKRITPEMKQKQALAVENEIPMTSEGETNPLRNFINNEEGPMLDRNAQPTSWSKFHLENPLSENIRADLVNGEVTAPDRVDDSLRPHGYAGDMDRFFSGGMPNRARVAAGFMPEHEGPTLNESDPPWIQRFEALYQKEHRGTLTQPEQDELDILQQQVEKRYGSIAAYDRQRQAEGIPNQHEPLQAEMRKTPQQRAQERLRQAGFMPETDDKKALTPAQFLAKFRNADRNSSTDQENTRQSIAAVIGSSDEASGGAQGSTSRDSQKKALTEWALQNGKAIYSLPKPFDFNSKNNVGGQEHDVWLDHPTQRWLKVTKPSFGVYPGLNSSKTNWTLSRADPAQYLQKLNGLKEFSGINTDIEGVFLDKRNNPSIIISQPDVHGTALSQDGIDHHMKQSGFLRIGDATATYYRPEDNFAAFDAHPGNMVESDGKAIAFDGIYIHPEGELKALIQEQYAKAVKRKPAVLKTGSLLDIARAQMAGSPARFAPSAIPGMDITPQMPRPNIRALAQQRQKKRELETDSK
jgi:hypothetical protein